jgi:hypothetical protein
MLLSARVARICSSKYVHVQRGRQIRSQLLLLLRWLLLLLLLLLLVVVVVRQGRQHRNRKSWRAVLARSASARTAARVASILPLLLQFSPRICQQLHREDGLQIIGAKPCRAAVFEFVEFAMLQLEGDDQLLPESAPQSAVSGDQVSPVRSARCAEGMQVVTNGFATLCCQTLQLDLMRTCHDLGPAVLSIDKDKELLPIVDRRRGERR